jgi:PAS domain S-box-containing protein
VTETVQPDAPRPAAAASPGGPAAGGAGGLRLDPITAAAVLEVAPEAIVIVGADGAIRAANAAATRLFGYPREELVGRPVDTLLPERARTLHAGHRADYFAAPAARPMGRGLALRARRKDGTAFPVEISLRCVDGEAGRLAIAFVTDVTERTRAERRLRTEFAVTRVLAERPTIQHAAPGLLQALCECLGWELGELWLVDEDENVLRWAGSWHASGLDGDGFAAATRSLTFAPGVGLAGRAWTSDQPIWMPDVTGEAGFLRAAEARRAGLRGACGVPIRSREHIVAVALFFCRELRRPDAELADLLTDVAHRIGLYLEYRRTHEALERQREILRQQERLAALGTLAAGLAHEINNPIAVVSSRIELMLEDASPGLPTETREDLLVLQRNVRRVGQLAQGLLAFARQAPQERRPLDVNRVVEETLLLTERQMLALGIEVGRRLDRALPAILGDPSALQQVVLNLLTNARDAMAGGGRLTIETRRAPGQGGWIELRVSDTGPGIAPDTLPRIFDPFFTTKAHGTGLGLSLSYGIVQAHGGTIQVASEPGRGTTFALAFRVAGDPGLTPAPGTPAV